MNPIELKKDHEILSDALLEIITLMGPSWCANVCNTNKQEFSNYKYGRRWSIEKEYRVYRMLWDGLVENKKEIEKKAKAYATIVKSINNYLT